MLFICQHNRRVSEATDGGYSRFHTVLKASHSVEALETGEGLQHSDGFGNGFGAREGAPQVDTLHQYGQGMSSPFVACSDDLLELRVERGEGA